MSNSKSAMQRIRWTNGALLGAAVGAATILAAATAQAQDTQPRLDSAYHNYQPPYPDSAQVNGEQGDVVLHVQISTAGKVRQVQITRSSGFPDLDNAAVEGVMGWRYHPAMQGGDTATAWTDVTIAYHLPTAPAAPAKPASGPSN